MWFIYADFVFLIRYMTFNFYVYIDLTSIAITLLSCCAWLQTEMCIVKTKTNKTDMEWNWCVDCI